MDTCDLTFVGVLLMDTSDLVIAGVLKSDPNSGGHQRFSYHWCLQDTSDH